MLKGKDEFPCVLNSWREKKTALKNYCFNDIWSCHKDVNLIQHSQHVSPVKTNRRLKASGTVKYIELFNDLMIKRWNLIISEGGHKVPNSVKPITGQPILCKRQQSWYIFYSIIESSWNNIQTFSFWCSVVTMDPF